MPSPLQTVRFTQQVKRLFSLRHRDPALQVLDDVLPVSDTYDVQAAEMHRTRGEDWAGGNGAGINGVANFTKVHLVNDTPGLLVVVESVDFSDNLASVVQYDAYLGPTAGQLPAPPAGQNAMLLDTRAPIATGLLPKARLVAQANATVFQASTGMGLLSHVLVNVAAPQLLAVRGIVLVNGMELVVVCPTLNAANYNVNVNVRWRERLIDTGDAELG